MDDRPPFADALRAVAMVESQLQAIERRFDSTGKPLTGDARGIALDRIATELGMLDDYLTGRSDKPGAIGLAAERLLNGHGVYMLVLSDERSVLTLDSFPVTDGFLQLETDNEIVAVRWADLMNDDP